MEEHGAIRVRGPLQRAGLIRLPDLLISVRSTDRHILEILDFGAALAPNLYHLF